MEMDSETKITVVNLKERMEQKKTNIHKRRPNAMLKEMMKMKIEGRKRKTKREISRKIRIRRGSRRKNENEEIKKGKRID